MKAHTRDLEIGILLVGILSLGPVGVALAAPAEGGAGVDLDAVVEQLRSDDPSLTKEDALAIAQEAASDVGGRMAAERVGTAGENAGIIVAGPGGLGAPEVGGGPVPGPEMTDAERAFAERIGGRAEELARQGLSKGEIDAAIKTEFEKEFEQFKEKGHEWSGERDDTRLRELYQEGRPGGETLEHHREFGERPTHEQMERYREHGGEVERPGHEASERATVEREEHTPVKQEAPAHQKTERPMGEAEMPRY